tara:strand:+ start:308 stop:415 length:108 start_codon:yes stop_codon:yes gene_type:complete
MYIARALMIVLNLVFMYCEDLFEGPYRGNPKLLAM